MGSGPLSVYGEGRRPKARGEVCLGRRNSFSHSTVFRPRRAKAPQVPARSRTGKKVRKRWIRFLGKRCRRCRRKNHPGGIPERPSGGRPYQGQGRNSKTTRPPGLEPALPSSRPWERRKKSAKQAPRNRRKRPKSSLRERGNRSDLPSARSRPSWRAWRGTERREESRPRRAPQTTPSPPPGGGGRRGGL